MSLSDNSLQLPGDDLKQSSVDRPPKSQTVDDEDSLPSLSIPPSLASSIHTLQPPQATTPNSSRSSKKAANLQQILFGEPSLEDGHQSTSLYELSGSIESVSTTKDKKKVNTLSDYLIYSKKKSSKANSEDQQEVESLLGISLSSVHSMAADSVGVTVVRTADSTGSAEKQATKKKSPKATPSGASKYWWDHLVDADGSPNQEQGLVLVSSSSHLCRPSHGWQYYQSWEWFREWWWQ